jgi:hypothetical protein
MNAVGSRPNPLPFIAVVAAVLGAAAVGFAATTGSITILVLLVGVAAAAVVVSEWTLGVPLLLLVSATDGFIKHFSDSAFTFVLKDALLALVLIGLALRLGMQSAERGDRVRWRGTLAWGIYIGFLTTQLVHPAFSLPGALGAFRAHALFGLLFVVGAIYFQRRERLTRTANLAIVICMLCALSAVVQNVMGDRWLHLSPGFLKASLHYTTFPSLAARLQGLRGATFRMYGTLVDPASLGLACAYGIIIAMAALARLRGFMRIVAIAGIPLMAAGLALSQARADMAGLAAGLVVFAALALRSKETRAIAIAGLLLIAAAIPVGIIATHGTVLDRVLATDSVAYAQATRDRSRDIVIAELPSFPFGHGLGAAGAGGNLRDEEGLAVDSLYFSTLYETGIVGLFTLLFVQGTLLVLGIRAVLRTKDVGPRTVFIGIVAGQCALLVSGWFSQGPFDYAPMAQFFWLFSGAVARADDWA